MKQWLPLLVGILLGQSIILRAGDTLQDIAGRCVVALCIHFLLFTNAWHTVREYSISALFSGGTRMTVQTMVQQFFVCILLAIVRYVGLQTIRGLHGGIMEQSTNRYLLIIAGILIIGLGSHPIRPLSHHFRACLPFLMGGIAMISIVPSMWYIGGGTYMGLCILLGGLGYGIGVRLSR